MTDPIREALTRAALRCPDDGELAEALALYDARADERRTIRRPIATDGSIIPSDTFREVLVRRVEAGTDGTPYDDGSYESSRFILALYDAHHPDPGGAGVTVTMYVMRSVEDGTIDWETVDYTVAAVESYRQDMLIPECWEIVRVVATVTPVTPVEGDADDRS